MRSNNRYSYIPDKLIDECKFAEEFIKKCTRSDSGYDSCQQPFFLGDKKEDGKVDFNTAEVNKKLGKIPLHFKLKNIYRIIGRIDIEHYYNDWTLLSLNKIEQFYDGYVEKGQKRSVNFAMKYAGMGHVLMATFDPVTEKIYYKMEGGASGYDVDYNFKKACEYIPLENELFDISHWFDLMETENLDIFTVPMIG